MSDIYQFAAEETAKAFAEFGQSIELKRVKKTEDIITGEVTQTQVIRGTIIGIKVSDASAKLIYENRFGEGFSSERIRYFKVAAESATFEPEAGDIGVLDNENWECLGSSAVNPAGTPIAFNVGFMRK